MRPAQRPKRFGTASNPVLVGYMAKFNDIKDAKNPYRRGTDDYKRWKKAYRQAAVPAWRKP